MDLRVFVVLALGSAILALVARPYRRTALAIGLLGLLGCLAATLVLDEAGTAELFGGRLVASPFLRLFLLSASSAGLTVCLIALATRWQEDLPAATLVVLAGSALALSLDSLAMAIFGATAAGAIGLAVVTAPTRPADAERPGGSGAALGYLQALATAGAIGVVAAAWLVSSAGALSVDGFAGGAAALAMGLALAIRLGVIPFHGPAARIVRAAEPLAVPLVLAWLPVLLFLVALGWSQRAFLAQEPDLATVRPVLAVVGAGSLVLGALGMLGRPRESDDLQHIVSYSIVQDAGLFLLAFAAFNAAAWEPARSWALYFALSKTAVAAWMAGVVATRGSPALSQLEGWARGHPVLVLALLGALAAGLGVPGLGSWEARLAVIQAVPIRLVRWIAYGGWAFAYLPFIRVLWIGLRAPAPAPADERRVRLVLADPRPSRGDLRSIATFTLDTLRLSRLAVALTLVLALGLGAGVLAVVPGGLADAAAPLPEPILPVASPSP